MPAPRWMLVAPPHAQFTVPPRTCLLTSPPLHHREGETAAGIISEKTLILSFHLFRATLGSPIAAGEICLSLCPGTGRDGTGWTGLDGTGLKGLS